jgi:hypothetical protein
VQGNPTSFGPSGGTGTATVGVSRECAWSASSTASWLEITSSREGQGDATLSFRVQPNSNPAVRRGTISIAEQRIEVSQQGPPCTFSAAASGSSVGADGGQVRVDVSTHSACGWTAAADVPWITLTPAAGTGPGSIQVNVSANQGSAPRTATIVAGGQALPLTQASRTTPAPPTPPPPAPGPTPPPPSPPPTPPGPTPPGCDFRVSPRDRSFTFVGGTGSVSVTAGAGCTWKASSNERWVTIVGEGSGSGSGEVNYLVLPNALQAAREALITIARATHTIRQSGVVGGDDDEGKKKRVKVEGNISGLAGSCPSRQFIVDDRVVITSSQTNFRGGNCEHLVNGLKVEVEGDQQANGTIEARDVRLHR